MIDRLNDRQYLAIELILALMFTFSDASEAIGTTKVAGLVMSIYLITILGVYFKRSGYFKSIKRMVNRFNQSHIWEVGLNELLPKY